jgi:hypothetical protein
MLDLTSAWPPIALARLANRRSSSDICEHSRKLLSSRWATVR